MEDRIDHILGWGINLIISIVYNILLLTLLIYLLATQQYILGGCLLLYKVVLGIISYYVMRNYYTRTSIYNTLQYFTTPTTSEVDTIIKTTLESYKNTDWFDLLVLGITSEVILYYILIHHRHNLKRILPLDLTKDFNSDYKKHILKKGTLRSN